MTNPPELCYCAKCGAQPGEPCRTNGGNRTTFHNARTGSATREQVWNATRLECWRTGYRAGASGMSVKIAEESATTYVAPQDYMIGFSEGNRSVANAEAKARKRYMK